MSLNFVSFYFDIFNPYFMVLPFSYVNICFLYIIE